MGVLSSVGVRLKVSVKIGEKRAIGVEASMEGSNVHGAFRGYFRESTQDGFRQSTDDCSAYSNDSKKGRKWLREPSMRLPSNVNSILRECPIRTESWLFVMASHDSVINKA